MTIDPATIEAGGTVDVTLIDGSKLTGAVLTDRYGSLWCAGNWIKFRNPEGGLGACIASIDAYTPPETPRPAWDREGVSCVADCNGNAWQGEGGSDDKWWGIGDAEEYYTAAELEHVYGPCTPMILAEVTDAMVERAADKLRQSPGKTPVPDGLRAILEAALGIEARP